MAPPLDSATDAAFDLVIRGGTLYDGTGGPPRVCDVGVRDGRVAAVSTEPNTLPEGKETLDATGRWVTPGFVDLHTHYDAEIEFAPALYESLRHGVTTVFLGSCSLSAALGEPEDIADIFCRVEGVPRQHMLPMLEARKDWHTLPDYLRHLSELPLGPNVAAYVGHSNLRMHVMGFERSVDATVRPTEAEHATMARLLEEALDAGYLGLSVQTLPWDKLDGTRERSKPLPSYFATWSEFRRLTRILRQRRRVFQGVPNLVTKVNVLLFMLESVGLWRPKLRTTVISLMDLIADRRVRWLVPMLTRVVNRVLGGDFRMQALPNPFEVRADGIDLVIFEEFAAGTEALHLTDLADRADLMRDPAWRRRFRKQWGSLFLPRVYHRDLRHSTIEACPDARVVGRSFVDVAAERGQHPADLFLDLCAEHGPALRWHTVVANDRREPLQRITADPDVLIGFSDAGAHLRNMAFYNFPLRLLRLVREAEQRGAPYMSVERAVHRVTGEIAGWFGLDVGVVAEGRQADLVVVNPEGLDADCDVLHESEMPGFPGLMRLVNRNARAVDAVVVRGRVASRGDTPARDLGQVAYGQVLRPAP